MSFYGHKKLVHHIHKGDIGYEVQPSVCLSVQIPVAPQCVTSAFPTTVDHSVTSAVPASSGHPLGVFTVTAVATQILRLPSSFVIPKLATACTASTTQRGPSASSARQASSATPQLITAHGQVSCASDFNVSCCFSARRRLHKFTLHLVFSYKFENICYEVAYTLHRD